MQKVQVSRLKSLIEYTYNSFSMLSADFVIVAYCHVRKCWHILEMLLLLGSSWCINNVFFFFSLLHAFLFRRTLFRGSSILSHAVGEGASAFSHKKPSNLTGRSKVLLTVPTLQYTELDLYMFLVLWKWMNKRMSGFFQSFLAFSTACN